ncbi:arginase [Capsaspora owczarzaki ATCC 30864]|uniref:Arginase n=1 Tax=Capsaspora owczarzaki (strain ATCC 30864) TaxID=595528 RepID=A0A0D2WII0_CAPO3|nr:arginase [Capsaspora owczarzaki ATCC 30864]KJE88853.1 arginase [Capsaspora owczarzaki ATCC 30864]|eukprot:XP_004365300.2 arginase [Capsaspora owczarzaki ATCC 30864]
MIKQALYSYMPNRANLSLAVHICSIQQRKMPKPGDPRLGELIQQGSAGRLVLLGFPFDEGVRRNGGRLGSKDGPDSVRKYISGMGTLINPELNVNLNTISISDAGNIRSDIKLEDAHQLLSSKVAELIGAGSIPFVIGGGNDQSYANARGLILQRSKSIGVVNIDAHFDVRPLEHGTVHSGTPFYQLLRDPEFINAAGKFVEFAAQGSQCSAEHAEFIRQRNHRIMWLSEVKSAKKQAGMQTVFKNLLDSLGDDLFVSFDLDAVRGADAPGVSCSSCIGLSAQDALDICFVAGRHPNVRLFDLSEFNPAIEEYRTGRLVVMMFYHFALGLAQRELDLKQASA